MRKSYVFLIVLTAIILVSGCSLLGLGSRLKVKFYNYTSSNYTITSIRLYDGGVPGEELLPEGQVLPPCYYFYRMTSVPNGETRPLIITVDDGTGGTVEISTVNGSPLGVPHWGGNTRSVGFKVIDDGGAIAVTEWFDSVGFDSGSNVGTYEL